MRVFQGYADYRKRLASVVHTDSRRTPHRSGSENRAYRKSASLIGGVPGQDPTTHLARLFYGEIARSIPCSAAALCPHVAGSCGAGIVALSDLRHTRKRDPIGTPAVALDDVLGAFDRNLRSEHGAERVEFGPAESLAGGRGHADWA